MKEDKVKHLIKRILILSVFLCILWGCAPKQDESAETKTAFQYEHDPCENPEAMKDIIKDPLAVYGFSPDPDSTRLKEYAEYDWSDEEFVADAQERRRQYHQGMVRDEGASTEEIAREVCAERNRLRLQSYENDPEGLEKIKSPTWIPTVRKKGPHRTSSMKNTVPGRSSSRKPSRRIRGWMRYADSMMKIIRSTSNSA